MSKRDFFIVLIRVFGLYSAVLTVFSVLPSTFAFWAAVLYSDGYDDHMVWVIVVSVVTLSVTLLWLLIRKAPRIVALLKLDEGLDEERIEIGQLRPHDLVAFGTFVVGGLLFVNSVAGFITRCYSAFKSSMPGYDFTSHDQMDWAMSAVNVVVGYLLVAHHQRIAGKLFKP